MRRWVFLAAMSIVFAAAAIAQNLPTIDSIPGIQAGSILVLNLRGDTSGRVWGTDVYTSDSSLAAAAVHAGALGSGMSGTVYVEVLPGAASYAGSSRNGVTSASYGSFGMSYRFLKTFPKFGAAGTTGSTTGTSETQSSFAQTQRIFAFKDESAIAAITFVPGASVYCRVTGSTAGRLWGTDVYTSDSSLAAAAVHAGIVKPGQTAIVRVMMMGPKQAFSGSSQNGVTSSSYGSYGASYSIAQAPSAAQVIDMLPNPGRADQLPGAAPGQTFVVWILGQSGGSIWGTDIYTSDSPLAIAAVHAGLVRVGEAAPVVVRILPGQNSYSGTARNGVTSASYGSFGMSYSLDSRL